MCYTVVKYVQYACTHRYSDVKQSVDCNLENCRFSRAHLTGPHDCLRTCIQERREDTGLVMPERIPARCASCSPPPSI